MFRGQFEHTIDQKGRISLPARFRELLSSRGSDRLVLTVDVEPCLLAFPTSEWEAFERKLGELPSMDRRVRMVKRTLIGAAHEVGVDKNGRILIPPPLREHAGLERDVVFAGQIDRIEIWSQSGWARVRDSVDPDALQDALEGLGI